MRFLYLYSLSCLATVSRSDPCSTLCLTEGPTVCTGGSYVQNGYCHGYVYRGDRALDDFCYRTTESAATCPDGEGVKVTDVARLLVLRYGEAATVENFLIDSVSGTTYSGEVLMKSEFVKPHGRGVLRYTSGVSYEGDFYLGKKHGQGTQITPSPNGSVKIVTCSWKNDWIAGGPGHIIQNGEEYRGILMEGGVKNGFGTQTFGNGDVYEGSWLNNKMSGKGTLKRRDGSVLKGTFKDNDLYGWGSETSADGSEVYDGEFARNKRQGFGRMKFSDGAVYEGHWSSGNMKGLGILTKAYGYMHYGSFASGKIPTQKVSGRSSSEDMNKFLRWKNLHITPLFLTEYHAKKNWDAIVVLIESEELAVMFSSKFKDSITEVIAKAIGSNNHVALRNLVAVGPDQSAQFMMQSAQMGDMHAIRALVAAGADITYSYDEKTPFVAAIRGGHFEVARALVEMGARRDLADSDLDLLLNNPTPEKNRLLELLIEYPSFQTKLLHLEPSVRVIEMIKSHDPLGFTSTMNKVFVSMLLYGNVETADELVRNGAGFPWDSSILVDLVRHSAPERAIEYILDRGVRAGIVEALGIAVKQASPKRLALLLSRCEVSEMDARRLDGTPLLVAVGQRRQEREGSIESLKVLLEGGITLGREEALLEAAFMGNMRLMDLLISFGADVRAVNQEGETALILAVKNRKKDAVAALVGQVDVDVQDNAHCSAFCWAVETDQLDLVEILANHGADVNVRGLSGVAPLVSICRDNRNRSGINNMLNALVSAGVTLGAPEALFLALRSQNLNVVEILLSSDSIVRESLETIDETTGETPLIVAIKLEHFEASQMLVRAGANVNNPGKQIKLPLFHALTERSEAHVDLVVTNGAGVNVEDSEGMTPLILASRCGVSSLLLLLESGATLGKEEAFRASAAGGHLDHVRVLIGKFPGIVNSQNASGETALMLAVREARFSMTNFLLAAAGAEKELRDKNGATAVDMAKAAPVEIIRLFMNHGADLDPRDDLVVARIEDICRMPRTLEGSLTLRFLIETGPACGFGKALYFASRNGAEEYVKLLLSTSCDADAVNVREEGGDTPLIAAILGDRLSVVQMLLAAGADLRAPGERGRSALEMALGNRPLEALNLMGTPIRTIVLEHILRSERSPSYNAIVESIEGTNSRGETALMLASSQGLLTLVEALIGASADVNYQSPRGGTALGMAFRNNRIDVVECLLSHGAAFPEELIAEVILFPRAAELERGRMKSTVALAVNRDQIFYDSIDFLLQDPRVMFNGPAYVNFMDENGIDSGGLRREWLSAIPRNIFEDLNLFTRNQDGAFVDFDRSLQVDARIYTAFGRFLGMVLLKSAHVPVALPSMFYAKLLGRKITLNELSEAYPARADDIRFLERISSQETELHEDFSVPELGGLKTFSGTGIEGIYPSASELLDEIINSYFSGPKMEYIRNGFNDLVPIDALREKNVMPSTLAEMIFGAQVINGIQIADNLALRDGRRNGVFDTLFGWLQEWLKSADQPKLRNFARFVTGSPQVPSDGFTGANAIKVATWPAGLGEDRYPHSHTCDVTIDLPEAVTDQQEFVRNLEIAIQTTGFGAA